MSLRFSGWSLPSNLVTSADSYLVPRTETEGGEGQKVLVKASPGLPERAARPWCCALQRLLPVRQMPGRQRRMSATEPRDCIRRRSPAPNCCVSIVRAEES